MNVLNPEAEARLVEVIQWLERGAPHETHHGQVVWGFNMYVGVAHPGEGGCGAVCCIAGAICQFNDPFSLWDEESEVDWRGPEGVMDRAMDMLGVSYELADKLFRPGEDNDHITPAVAAKTLRHFLDTGDVVWPDAPED